MLRALLTATCMSVLVLSTCGDGVSPTGDLVGGPCSTADECDVESVCEQGGDFPGGMCTLPCRFQDDCPLGAACIDKSGGLCAIACVVHADCRGGYRCKAKKRKERDGETLVCLGD